MVGKIKRGEIIIMIFSENFERITSEGLRDGIKNYLVITDQLADNLHDFVVLFAKENDNESAKVMNNAEIKVRKARLRRRCA